jgi:trans-aconitate methyltransferase
LGAVEGRFIWNPADYAAHSASQQVWARELIAKLNLRGDERILDVGCGDGKVTAELSLEVSRGAVVGIDSSPDMVRFARETFGSGKFPNLNFRVMDARELELDGRFDLVFSNATLHWVDNHPAFLRGAAACLRRGGRLVVSCGGKGNAQDVFNALRPELRLQRWRKYFRRLEAPYFFYSPEEYLEWLPRYDFATADVQLASRDAVPEGRDGFAAWLRTTWLPYTQRVPEDLRDEFITGVVDRYLAQHPPDPAGRVHVRMVRLEIDAVRS